MRISAWSQLDYHRALPFQRIKHRWHGDRFTHIKQVVKDQLDHRNLNEVLPFNPTAENIARWICDQLPTCYKVEVQESEGNTAIYEKD